MTLASLEEPMPVPPAGPTQSQPLVLEVTGEAVAGEEIEVTVTGAEPGSQVELSLGDDVVGTATADAEGAATFTVPLPGSTETSEQVLTATGIDGNGLETTGSLTVTVTGVEEPTETPTEEPTRPGRPPWAPGPPPWAPGPPPWAGGPPPWAGGPGDGDEPGPPWATDRPGKKKPHPVFG